MRLTLSSTCSRDAYRLPAMGLGSGTTGKLGHAWVGAWDIVLKKLVTYIRALNLSRSYLVNLILHSLPALSLYSCLCMSVRATEVRALISDENDCRSPTFTFHVCGRLIIRITKPFKNAIGKETW